MLDRLDPATVSLERAVAGQYVLEKEIGRGGMGIVFLADDVQLERSVAIKTLPVHLAADAQVRSRFLREARTAGALSHPNIVPIYVAAERDGVVYFVMRYIAGESLADRIARLGTVNARDTVVLLKQLASALSHAHAHGVVHRDIKAENVLLEGESLRAMLTDFGIARLAETKALTATGTVLGTVQYMSPEQVNGDTLDGRSDLYSLGVLAYHMLTGSFPFERSSASAILVAHVNANPPRMQDVAPSAPAALCAIVDRLLLKSRDERFADGAAVQRALDAVPAIVEGPVHAIVAAATPVAEAPTVMSSDDAKQVWARAAELQANTGVYTPPPAFTPRDDAGALVTTGYDTMLVRNAAVDAGIDAKYVERALVERASAVPVIIVPGPQMQKKLNRLIGARVKLDYETSIDGELREDGFEEIADEVRRLLGEMVTVSAVGRTLTITTALAATRQGTNMRRLQVNVSSRNGRTTLRGNEDLGQQAMSWFVGLTMGVGFSGGTAVLGAIMGTTHNPLLGFGAMGVTLISAFSTARLMFRRTSRKRDIELREVMQKLVLKAREYVVQPVALPRAISDPPI